MKNILIPTDFSENAWNAIIYGMSLFKKTHCTFHIMHVSPTVLSTSGETAIVLPPEILEESLLKECKKELEELLKKIEKLPLNEKHNFKITARYGFFIDHIKQEVASKKIDLILMGTKGATGLKKVALGSNTGNVITKVKCAVLAVPENCTILRPVKIGFPTDLLIDYSLQVLLLIKETILLTNAQLCFLHVETKKGELTPLQIKNQQFLKDYFKDNRHSFHTLKGKKLDHAIESFVEKEKLDMLVMVAKNLNFLERILFRPSVEEISYHTKIPFLVLHE